jgi:WD40 repeat protein
VNIQGAPLAVAFNPKGRLIAATASHWPQPPDLWFWDEKTGKKANAGKGHTKGVLRIALSSDGAMAASAADDQTVRLWDVATGRNTATFDKLPKWSSIGLTFSPDGKVLAMDYKGEHGDIKKSGTVLLLEVPTGKILAKLEGHKGVVTCVAFSGDGRLLATGSVEGEIKIWSLPRRYAEAKEGEKEEGK